MFGCPIDSTAPGVLGDKEGEMTRARVEIKRWVHLLSPENHISRCLGSDPVTLCAPGRDLDEAGVGVTTCVL